MRRKRSTIWGLAIVLISAALTVPRALLSPESSPVGRGATIAAARRCADPQCRDELSGSAPLCEDLPDGAACADVSAFWIAARLKHNLEQRLQVAPQNELLHGERLARERNCFRCHGELGQGGLVNAGALKGYIPGYFGSDFRALTNGGDRNAVREWIMTGSSRALTERPLVGFFARFFLERQAISMPRFSSLPAVEIERLTDYVIALNTYGPLDSVGLKEYAIDTAASSDWLAKTFREQSGAPSN